MTAEEYRLMWLPLKEKFLNDRTFSSKATINLCNLIGISTSIVWSNNALKPEMERYLTLLRGPNHAALIKIHKVKNGWTEKDEETWLV